MPFQRLSDLMLQYHLQLHQDRAPLDMEKRLGAATLAILVHRERAITVPAIVNTAALALSQERLTVHRLDAESISQVQESFIESLPADPPTLLQSGWIVESADLNVPLFDDVVSLGGYAIEGQAWVIGLRYPDGVFVGQWRPRWGDQDIESAFYETLPDFIDDTEVHKESTIQAIAFALTLGALLDAENTPMEARQERVETGIPRRKPAPKNSRPLAWNVRHLSLKPLPVTEGGEQETTAETEATARSREGLQPVKRTIRGFLRRQPFGPGRTERKWVYVAAFEATRYVGTKPLRVDIRAGGEE